MPDSERLLVPRTVHPALQDGSRISGGRAYEVSFSESQASIRIACADDPNGGWVSIERFAWAGIVEAVAALEAEAEELAAQSVAVSRLMDGEED